MLTMEQPKQKTTFSEMEVLQLASIAQIMDKLVADCEDFKEKEVIRFRYYLDFDWDVLAKKVYAGQNLYKWESSRAARTVVLCVRDITKRVATGELKNGTIVDQYLANHVRGAAEILGKKQTEFYTTTRPQSSEGFVSSEDFLLLIGHIVFLRQSRSDSGGRNPEYLRALGKQTLDIIMANFAKKRESL